MYHMSNGDIKFHVCCKKNFQPETKAHVVCRSLRGGPRKIAVKLGSGASLTTWLHKLDSIYGIIERKEKLLEEFYSAHQSQGETT